MTTFKFNFSAEEGVKDSKDASPVTKEDNHWFESFEITPNNQIIKDLDCIVNHAKIFACGDVEIGHVLASELLPKMEDCEIKHLLAENEHNDLVVGKYEGGLKIWECTSDMVSYFEENKEYINFENKQVLDLGCGAGILGIYAFMNKANVTFQDYNTEVIEHATIPNVLLNIEEDEREVGIKRCKFFSGDWASFYKKCTDNYDLIITSETIYNENNYNKLLSFFLDRLNSNGSVYVAAKTHYFGVGGGTRQFEELIKSNGSLNIEACWKSSGGIQREILKITKNDS